MRHLLLLLGILCLSACKKEVGKQSAVDTALDIRLDRDPDRLHPAIFPRSTPRQVFSLIMVPLANYDPISTKLEPILITELPEKQVLPDGTVAFDLEIRQDATWPDGSPVTGYDYEFTIKAINHPGVNAANYRSYTQAIKDVTVDADQPKKFRVILGEDYLLALETVVTIELYPRYHYDPQDRLASSTLSSLAQLSDADLKKDTTLVAFADAFNGAYYSQHPVGAGPYELTDYTTNQVVTLSEKEDYWGANYPSVEALQSGPATINFHIIPDESTATTLLKDGSIDLIPNLQGATYNDLRSSDYSMDILNFTTTPAAKFYMLQLNTACPELRDPRVRQALDYLVDKKTLTTALETGTELIPNSHILPSSPYYNQDLPAHRFDIEEAQALLDQAGWTDSDGDGIRDKVVDGKRLSLQLNMGATPGRLSADIGEIFKRDAAAAGIDVQLIPQTYKVYKSEYVETGKFHIAAIIAGQDLSLYDPFQRYHSSTQGLGSNFSGYSKPEMDQLVEGIRAGGDYAQLKPLYDRFQTLVDEDKPIIFLYLPSIKMVFSKNWKITPTIARPGYVATTAQSTK